MIAELRREARLAHKKQAGCVAWGRDFDGLLKARAALRRGCNGQHPRCAARGADRAELGTFVAGRDDAQNAGIERIEKRHVIGGGQIGLEATDRVIDDVDTIGDRIVDGFCEIGGRAARASLSGLDPAGFVNRYARTRRDPADFGDPCAEDAGRDRVAGDRRCDMRAVTVGVFRRDELVLIERVTRQEAIDVIACADELVVAVIAREAIAGLTCAVKARWRVVRGSCRGILTD